MIYIVLKTFIKLPVDRPITFHFLPKTFIKLPVDRLQYIFYLSIRTWDTVGKRAVCILLECFIVSDVFVLPLISLQADCDIWLTYKKQ